jgi:hypothetical protein
MRSPLFVLLSVMFVSNSAYAGTGVCNFWLHGETFREVKGRKELPLPRSGTVNLVLAEVDGLSIVYVSKDGEPHMYLMRGGEFLGRSRAYENGNFIALTMSGGTSPEFGYVACTFDLASGAAFSDSRAKRPGGDTVSAPVPALASAQPRESAASAP